MNRSHCPCSKDTSYLLMPKDQSKAAGVTHPPHRCLHPSLKILILSLGPSKGDQWPATTGSLQHSLPSAVPRLSCSHHSPDCAYGWGREAWKERLPWNQEKHLETLDAESVGKKLTTFMFIRRQINHYNNKISLWQLRKKKQKFFVYCVCNKVQRYLPLHYWLHRQVSAPGEG